MTKQEKKKKLFDQIIKFGVVGVLSCIIDFAVLWVLNNIFGVYYLIATFFGFMISLIFNYIASMAFVFQRKENVDRRKEFIVFMVLSLIGLGLNQLIMYVIVDLMYAHWKWVQVFIGFFYDNIGFLRAMTAGREELCVMGAKVVATGIVMVYNFVTRKKFIEKKD